MCSTTTAPIPRKCTREIKGGSGVENKKGGGEGSRVENGVRGKLDIVIVSYVCVRASIYRTNRFRVRAAQTVVETRKPPRGRVRANCRFTDLSFSCFTLTSKLQLIKQSSQVVKVTPQERGSNIRDARSNPYTFFFRTKKKKKKKCANLVKFTI